MKRMIPFMIGIGKLQRHASTVIREVEAKHNEGFIVSHNEPQAVLMSLQRYERLKNLEDARKLEEDEVLAILEKGDQEFKRGATRRNQSFDKTRTILDSTSKP